MPTIDEYLARITRQHADKPKYVQHVREFVQPFVDAQLLLESMTTAFDIDTAIGVQLDVVGQWVGRSRNVSTPLSGIYFSFDTLGVGWDQGSWKGKFDPDTGITQLDDEIYRVLLKAKIILNHWDGTIEQAALALELLFANSPGTTISLHDNQDMTMTVGVSGVVPPAVIISLLKGGYLPIAPSGVLVNYDVTSVSTHALFGFDAQNNAVQGWDFGTWAGAPTNAPGKPSGLTVSSVSTTSVTLNWVAPNTGTGPFSYQMLYKLSSSSVWIVSGSTVISTTGTIGNLVAGTSYDFAVYAVNSGGPGPQSITVTATTLPGTPPQVVGLTTTGTTINSIALQWSPVVGNAISYQPQYRLKGATPWTNFGQPIPSAAVNVTGLTQGTQYEFQVYAINPFSAGPPSAILSVSTTGTVPGAPQAPGATDVQLTQVSLSWGQPTTNNGPYQYVVQYRAKGTTAWTTWTGTVTATSNGGNSTVTGLDAGSPYEFQIYASNAAGNGPVSAIVSATTLDNTPDQVTGLNTTGNTTSSVSLAWLAANFAVTFQPQYRITGATAWINFGAPTASLSTTVTGLTAGVTYDFQVYGISSDNVNGPPSAILRAAPQATAPGQVTGVATSNASANGMTVSWSTATGTAPIVYQTQYKEAVATAWTDAGAPTQATSVTLTGLQTGTSYNFRVTASNDYGTGTTSATATASTTGTAAITTWNPAKPTVGSGTTLTNSNRTATTAAGNGDYSVRYGAVSTTSQTTGKRFAEFTINALSNLLSFGLGNASLVFANLTGGVGSDTNGLGLYPVAEHQGAFINDVQLSVGTTASVAGDTVSLAVDFDSNQFWFTTAAMRTAGNGWNNSTTANPSTGVGGLSMSLLTGGPYFLIIGDVSGGGGGTLNTGQANFVTTVPTGFSSWDGTGAAVIVPPGQVSGLSVASTTPTSIALTWTVPANNPTGYQTQFRKSGTTVWFNGPSIATATTTVLDLRPATNYEFQVYAFNQGGNGVASSVASGTTGAAVSPTVLPKRGLGLVGADLGTIANMPTTYPHANAILVPFFCSTAGQTSTDVVATIGQNTLAAWIAAGVTAGYEVYVAVMLTCRDGTPRQTITPGPSFAGVQTFMANLTSLLTQVAQTANSNNAKGMFCGVDLAPWAGNAAGDTGPYNSVNMGLWKAAYTAAKSAWPAGIIAYAAPMKALGVGSPTAPNAAKWDFWDAVGFSVYPGAPNTTTTQTAFQTYWDNNVDPDPNIAVACGNQPVFSALDSYSTTIGRPIWIVQMGIIPADNNQNAPGNRATVPPPFDYAMASEWWKAAFAEIARFPGSFAAVFVQDAGASMYNSTYNGINYWGVGTTTIAATIESGLTTLAPVGVTVGQVQGVSVTGTTTSSISVSWNTVTGTNIQYVPQISSHGANSWTSLTAQSATTASFSGLLSATQYDVRVYAQSGTTQGTPSAIVTATTGTVVQVGVQARRARDFTNSCAMETQLKYATQMGSSSPYFNAAATLARLDYHQPLGRGTGINVVRETLLDNNPYQTLLDWGSKGYKFIMGYFYAGNANWADQRDKIRAMISSGYVVCVEGPNEVNGFGPYQPNGTYVSPNGGSFAGAQGVAHFAIDVWSLFHNYNNHSEVKIAAWSIGDQSTGLGANNNTFQQTLSGDGYALTAVMDYGNTHYYPNGGYSPADPGGGNAYMDNQMTANSAANMALGQPVIITETGLIQGNYNGKMGSDYVNGAYAVEMYIHSFLKGNPWMVYYEQADFGPDDGTQETHFGMWNNDGTPKGPAVAVRDLMWITGDAGANATTFTPGKLNYSITNRQGNMQDLLLAKADGSAVICLSPNATVFQGGNYTAASFNDLVITLGATFPQVLVYDTGVNTTNSNIIGNGNWIANTPLPQPVMTINNVSQITVPFGDNPRFIVIPNAFTQGSSGLASPTGLTVTSSNASSIAVSWTAVSGTGIQYVPQIAPHGTTNWTSLAATASTNATFPNLTASTSYDMRVYAVSGSTQSAPTPVVTASTTSGGTTSSVIGVDLGSSANGNLRRMQDFWDMAGMGLKLDNGSGSNAWGNATFITSAINWLNPQGPTTGIWTFRQAMRPLAWVDFSSVLNTLGTAGYKFVWNINWDNGTTNSWDGGSQATNMINYVSKGWTYAVEGPNEVENTFGNTALEFLNYTAKNGQTYSGNGAAPVRWQQDLWNQFKTQVPVIMFTLGNGNNTANSAEVTYANNNGISLASLCDWGSSHYYGDFGYPVGNLQNPNHNPSRMDESVAANTALTGGANGKPVACTEVGFYNGVAYGADYGNGDVNSKYIPEMLADSFKRGYRWVAIYQLADDNAGDPNENFWGIFDSSGNARTSAVALRYLAGITGDNGSTKRSFLTGTCNFTVSGLNTAQGGGSLGFQRSNGDAFIVVYPNAAIYINGNNSTAPTQSVTVNLGKVYSKIDIFDPYSTAVNYANNTWKNAPVAPAPIQSLTNQSSINLSVTDRLLVIKIAASQGSSFTVSPDRSFITNTSGGAITDNSGNQWTINSAGQVAVNGTPDTTAPNTIEIAWVNGVIWREDSGGLWYSKVKPTDTWSAGTSASPFGTGTAGTGWPGGTAANTWGARPPSTTGPGNRSLVFKPPTTSFGNNDQFVNKFQDARDWKRTIGLAGSGGFWGWRVQSVWLVDYQFSFAGWWNIAYRKVFRIARRSASVMDVYCNQTSYLIANGEPLVFWHCGVDGSNNDDGTVTGDATTALGTATLTLKTQKYTVVDSAVVSVNGVNYEKYGVNFPAGNLPSGYDSGAGMGLTNLRLRHWNYYLDQNKTPRWQNKAIFDNFEQNVLPNGGYALLCSNQGIPTWRDWTAEFNDFGQFGKDLYAQEVEYTAARMSFWNPVHCAFELENEPVDSNFVSGGFLNFMYTTARNALGPDYTIIIKGTSFGALDWAYANMQSYRVPDNATAGNFGIAIHIYDRQQNYAIGPDTGHQIWFNADEAADLVAQEIDTLKTAIGAHIALITEFGMEGGFYPYGASPQSLGTDHYVRARGYGRLLTSCNAKGIPVFIWGYVGDDNNSVTFYTDENAPAGVDPGTNTVELLYVEFRAEASQTGTALAFSSLYYLPNGVRRIDDTNGNVIQMAPSTPTYTTPISQGLAGKAQVTGPLAGATAGALTAATWAGRMPYELLTPYNYNGTNNQYSLVVVLNDLGTGGTNNTGQLVNGVQIFNNASIAAGAPTDYRSRFPCFVVYPQAPLNNTGSASVSTSYGGYDNTVPQTEQDVRDLVASLIATYSIDPRRVYVVGLGMGGVGAYDLLWRYPDIFKAGLVLSGANINDPQNSRAPALARTPIWSVHNSGDPTIPASYDRNMYGAIHGIGGVMQYSENTSNSHDTWTAGLANTTMLGWLFAQGTAAASQGSGLPASRCVLVLQGQSNAAFLQAENDYYQNLLPGLIVNLTGIPDIRALGQQPDATQTDPNAQLAEGYTLFGGAGSFNYNSTDNSLLLDPNSTAAGVVKTNPSTWPLGTHGVAVKNFMQQQVAPLVSNGVPLCFLRFHSEYDTADSTGAVATYYADANRRFIATAVRSVFPTKPLIEFPIFYGSPHFWQSVTYSALEGVRAGWLSEVNNNANTNAHWLGLNFYDVHDRGDNSHGDDNAMKQDAVRIAMRLSRWLYDNGYSHQDCSWLPVTGPRLVRTARVASNTSQLDWIMQHDRGTDLVVPPVGQINYGAFYIFDNGSQRTVTDVSRINANTLRLTLDAPLAGTDAQILSDYCLQNGFYAPGGFTVGGLVTDNWHTLPATTGQAGWTALNNAFTPIVVPLAKTEMSVPISTAVIPLSDLPNAQAVSRTWSTNITTIGPSSANWQIFNHSNVAYGPWINLPNTNSVGGTTLTVTFQNAQDYLVLSFTSGTPAWTLYSDPTP